MSSSKVFTKTSAASPFVMARFKEAGAGEPEKAPDGAVLPVEAENVGSRLEAIEREAYERGFEAGEKAGFEFGRQKAEVLFSGLAGIIEELGAMKHSLHAACETEMVELAMAIARKVVQRELEVKSDTVIDIVRAALGAVAAAGEVMIKVNPKDLETMQAHKSEITRRAGGARGLVIEGDESIGRGGCIIETNYGEVDATIPALIAEVEEKLRDAYPGGRFP